MSKELTVKQAAALIGITASGVRKNIERGNLKARLVPGIVPHYRIRHADAEALGQEITRRIVRRGRPVRVAEISA